MRLNWGRKGLFSDAVSFDFVTPVAVPVVTSIQEPYFFDVGRPFTYRHLTPSGAAPAVNYIQKANFLDVGRPFHYRHLIPGEVVPEEEEERVGSGHYVPARRLYVRPRKEFDREEKLWIEKILALLDEFIPEEAAPEEVELAVRLRLGHEFEAIPTTYVDAKIDAAVEEMAAYRVMAFPVGPEIVRRKAIERIKKKTGIDDEDFLEMLLLYEMSEED